MNKEVTQERIIEFQSALISILETAKEGDLKSRLFIDSYKSVIQELKESLKMERAIQIVEDKILCLASLGGETEIFKTRILILQDILKDLKKVI